MTLPINEMGGLTTAEIELRINAAAGRQVNTLESKLKEHQDAMEKRLTQTDETVKDTLDRTIATAVDVAVIKDGNNRQTVLLEKMDKSSQEWHDADLLFRENVIVRVTSIEDETKRHGEILKTLRWLAATSVGVGKTVGLGLRIICTESFWKIAGVGILLLIADKASPWLFHILKHVLTP